MKITALGAAGGVTGSCYLIECGSSRVLLDCGMFQGEQHADAMNLDCSGIRPAELDAVVLTHAHLDHCGRLPILVKLDGVCEVPAGEAPTGGRAALAGGFKGRIWATPATIDMTQLILLDSAHIQESDAERENFKRLRRGDEPPIAPLYTTQDAEETLALLTPLDLAVEQEVAPGVRISFHEAGHILGSAAVVMKLSEGSERRTVVFSGDLGPRGMPLLRDYELLTTATAVTGAAAMTDARQTATGTGLLPDLIFCESTYGDRDHRPLESTVSELREILERAAWNKSKVIIPSFAVGRAQQLLYHIARFYAAGTCPRLPVYLDSPMAIRATALHTRYAELLDRGARTAGFAGDFAKLLPELRFLTTGAESRTLNDSWEPMIVIASSGMCEGGRIVHHLKHNLWKRNVEVVLVGYMGHGTLGRRLVDGASQVVIGREKIAVRARIHTLGGFSAHAGQTDLLGWLAPLLPARGKGGRTPRVALTHGETHARTVLAEQIRARHGVVCELPSRGDGFTL